VNKEEKMLGRGLR